MTLKPLDVLKKGLSKITQSFKVRKDELNAKLARKESISSSDEYCTIMFNWSRGVTYDAVDQILTSATFGVTWDRVKISAKLEAGDNL